MSDVRFIFLTHVSINDIRYGFDAKNERTNQRVKCNKIIQKKIIAFDSFKPSVVHSHINCTLSNWHIITTHSISIRKQRYSLQN